MSTSADPVRLCIVTVVRNGAATLERCLESVRSLTLRPVTHLLVDGMSSDASLEIIHRHAELANALGIETVVLQQEPRGVYAAMNFAVAHAPVDAVVFFLNADDALIPDGPWAEAVEAFEKPGMSFVYAGARFVKPDGRVEERPPHRIRDPGWISHQALVVRRSVLAAHPFEVHYGLAADSIWASRNLAGAQGVYLPEPLAEVKLIGLSYLHPWRVTASYTRYLVEEGHYLSAGVEWGRTALGILGRVLGPVVRTGKQFLSG